MSLRSLVTLCLVFVGAQFSPELRAEQKAMNVLFISIDDLRTELKSYGVERAYTPNIDKLASQGVKFERAYCQYPLCNPSRASLLTGRRNTTLELYGNRDWFNAFDPSLVSLPKYFKEHGYMTVRHGKIFHGDTIDDWKAWDVGGVPHKINAPKPASSVADRPITDAEEKERLAKMNAADLAYAPHSDLWKAVEDPQELANLGDTVNMERAIAFLKNRKPGDKPFFLGFGQAKPHSPLIAPKEYFDLYKNTKIDLPVDFAARPTVPAGFPKASIRESTADLFIQRDASPDEARAMILAYLACVSYIDHNVGRVLATLDETGLRDSTIVVFWSDHGYQLGEKGKWSKAGSLWEQGTRVPLIILDPRAQGNGHTSQRVVELVDLYPTLVDLCGLPMPAGLDGHILRPLLDQPDAKWDYPAYTVWNERSRGVSGVVVRTECWRYAEFFGPGAGAFLTDPINDPAELKNLVNDPQYKAVVAELSALARANVAGKTEPTP